jgi:dTDP-4-dehydrorhamnose reductase
MKPVAIVTGASGQLGSALAELLVRDYQVLALSHSDLDITNHQAVVHRIVPMAPTVILNASAYNDVDAAEDDALTAFNVNAIAVRSLARVAEATGAILVHYSSDFVFDGNISRPYVESDQPSSRSVYGQSKLVGEWMATSLASHYVLRVESLFGGSRTHSTIDGFLSALRGGSEVRAFHDREVSPSFVEDVVMATRVLLECRAPFGLYHCVNSGHASWADVAEEAARRLGVSDAKVKRVSVRDIALRAARPQYAALDNSKLVAAGVAMPDWRDALGRHIARIEAKPQRLM